MSKENSQLNQYETFCRDHGIDNNDVKTAIQRVRKVLTDVSIDFDIHKYATFGVLRLAFRKPGISMLPMLFGQPSNLSRLARSLWEVSSTTWSDEMDDLTHRGTYLKRRVLIPAILGAVESHYRPGFHILDAGCGEGVLFRELVRGYENVFAFDFVQLFIERLAEEYPDIHDRLSTADILEDNFTRKFEVVIASALLLTLSDIDLALQRLFELVAPGGTLIIADVCSRLHRSLGYYNGSELIRVHDPDRVAHFEKDIGGGQTTAIHNYHPPGYYRLRLERLGAICRTDKEILVTREAILSDPMLVPKDREKVLRSMTSDLVNPTFFLLVLSKEDAN